MGLGSTTLRAAQNLNGTLDGALITVLARSLDNGDARKSWQPEFRSLTCFGQLDQQLKTISGCFIESGTTDPDYNGDPKDYDASSARFIACGFYAFSGNGVFSGGNRQRFYAEHLRCVGNSGWGLRILGNDPVIGQRCGFGGNGKHQLYISGCSGIILQGVNMFSGSGGRSNNNLACLIDNVVGCSISGCVFNDTLVISSEADGNNARRGISVTGCDFRPNNGVLGSNGTPNGSADDSRNAYIYLADLRNITIAANSFCVDASGFAFRDILSVERSRVNISATITSDTNAPSARNYFPTGASPRSVPILADSASTVTYDVRDIFTGRHFIGSISQTPVRPVIRGATTTLDPAPYDGYVAVDSGPYLQTSAPEYTSQAIVFAVLAEAGTVSIPPTCRYTFISVGGEAGQGVINNGTIRLPIVSFHKDLTIIIRGTISGQLTWLPPTGSSPLSPASGDLSLPGRVSRRADINLVWRGPGVAGFTAIWYRARTEEVRLFLGSPDRTLITTTGAKLVYRTPGRMILTEVRGSLAISATSGTFEFDLRRGDLASPPSIFSTRPTFDATERTTVTAATPAVLATSPTTLVDDDMITLVVTNIANGSAAGLGVWLIGYKE